MLFGPGWFVCRHLRAHHLGSRHHGVLSQAPADARPILAAAVASSSLCQLPLGGLLDMLGGATQRKMPYDF